MVAMLRSVIALLVILLAVGIASCGGDRNAPTVLLGGDEATFTRNPLIGALAEVSPPESIQQLKPFLDVYEPQVRILSPGDNDLLKDTTVSVELQVRDFPLYQNAELGLGPHLHLFLDDRPYQEVYDTDDTIVFTDLAPGTHTLRALAARPWGESFKNDGAYDQVTFSVFAESPQNNPDNSQILLTYDQPQGSYGAEPIMLDFYLTNAPLHLVAENDEAIADWRIRCTVNGESFIFDRWQPIYLKGFQSGKNWVKLEIIDDNGNLINNAFNTGIRLIEYTPGGDDDLAKLIRGEIPLSEARRLVDPNYVPPTPVVEEEPPFPANEDDLEAEPEIAPEPADASDAFDASDAAAEPAAPEPAEPEPMETDTADQPQDLDVETPSDSTEPEPDQGDAIPDAADAFSDTPIDLPEEIETSLPESLEELTPTAERSDLEGLDETTDREAAELDGHPSEESLPDLSEPSSSNTVLETRPPTSEELDTAEIDRLELLAEEKPVPQSEYDAAQPPAGNSEHGLLERFRSPEASGVI